MDTYDTFFNILGDEPLAFVGDRVILVDSDLTAIHQNFTSGELIPISVSIIEDVIHTVITEEIRPGVILDMEDVIHTHNLNVDSLIGNISVELEDVIHKQFVYYKYNAFLSAHCNRYIHTAEENRYLDTPINNC